MAQIRVTWLKVKDYPTQRNASEVQSFKGFASYYRRFIKNFANVVEPLHHLLHKDNKFIWTEKCDSAFRTILNLLVSCPILAYPRFTETFQLQTDASAWAVGAVLSHQQDGAEQEIASASSTLSKSEKELVYI